MAKVSRDMLKVLVKECLFEILLESTGESTQSLVESRTKPKRRAVASKKKQSTRRPALDSISFGSKPKPKQKIQPPPPVDVSSITSDPVMASIFQDTAVTTLRDQAAAERGKHGALLGDGVSLDNASSDGSPSALLGEASQNWAYLAFNDKSE
jgi:hypothetical protein